MLKLQQFIDNEYALSTDEDGNKTYYELEVRDIAIKFAKYHIKRILKEVSKNIKIKHTYYDEDEYGIDKIREILDKEPYTAERIDSYGELYSVDIYSIDKNSILESYPLENIK